MMHARFALLGNPLPCHCCLCLHCSAPLRDVKILEAPLNHSLIILKCHRPMKSTTDHVNVIIDHKLGHRLDSDGRSALKVAGRPFIPAESCFCCSSGQTVHGKEISKQCMHGHTPYHVMDSRECGPWSSGHQSRISMHDGQRHQVC